MNRRRLTLRCYFQVFLRTFVLQGSWNFERLQNLGVLFALAPALRQLYAGKALKDAYRRNLAYFNTHPFLGAPILGAMLNLECARSEGRPEEIEVDDFRQMVMAPYAAIGDALFWGGLRPFAAGIALFFSFNGSFWAPVIFLLIFNLPHLFFRTAGLWLGWVQGWKVTETVQRYNLPDVAIRLKEGTVVLLGGLCAYLTFQLLRGEGVPIFCGLAVVPVVLLCGWATRKGLSTLLLVWSATAIAVALVGFFKI
ncbi:MAG: PTS system mannose/fructose/sorbose family transporter subunit IID [Desulfuromonadaceae bacterium]|nr:PTS system mannose/fructose/sorbose family transporter subunit IID [Desulfuromonadaceae bacterium]